MKIIYPEYGQGAFIGFPIEHSEMTNDLFKAITNCSLDEIEEAIEDSDDVDFDWLNFQDEAGDDLSGVVQLIWPDDNDDVYCYIGIIKNLKHINLFGFTFSIDEKIQMHEFKNKWFPKKIISDYLSISYSEN